MYTVIRYGECAICRNPHLATELAGLLSMRILSLWSWFGWVGAVSFFLVGYTYRVGWRQVLHCGKNSNVASTFYRVGEHCGLRPSKIRWLFCPLSFFQFYHLLRTYISPTQAHTCIARGDRGVVGVHVCGHVQRLGTCARHAHECRYCTITSRCHESLLCTDCSSSACYPVVTTWQSPSQNRFVQHYSLGIMTSKWKHKTSEFVLKYPR